MCPHTLRVHLQAYVYFGQPISASSCKDRCCGHPHVELRKGTHAQAKDYVCKSETRIAGPFEFGDPPAQGKRSDLDEVRKQIEAGTSMKEIGMAHFGSFCRYYKGFQTYKRLCQDQFRSWKTTVFYFYGPAGSGKTRMVYDREPADKVYALPKSVKGGVTWFCGYDGHEVILIDDFYGDIAWGFLLNLLDRYQLLGQTKGGMVPLVPKRIYITSNLHPDQLGYTMNHDPLDRRIDHLVEFTDENILVEHKGVMDQPGMAQAETAARNLMGEFDSVAEEDGFIVDDLIANQEDLDVICIEPPVVMAQANDPPSSQVVRMSEYESHETDDIFATTDLVQIIE